MRHSWPVPSYQGDDQPLIGEFINNDDLCSQGFYQRLIDLILETHHHNELMLQGSLNIQHGW